MYFLPKEREVFKRFEVKGKSNTGDWRQLRVDDTVRKAAEAKQDSRMISILTRELVAAEAHYHRSSYRQYTKTGETATSLEPDESDDDYAKAEARAFSRLCDYIRSDAFKDNQVLELSQLNERLQNWMIKSGVKEIKPSTSTHLRRKLKTEFGDFLHMIQNESNKIL